MGFLEKGAWLLTLIFFALKVAGVTEMGWGYVVLPLVINYGLFLFGLSLMWFGEWRQRRRSKSWIDRLMG